MQNFAGTLLGMLGVVKDFLRETTGMDLNDLVETNASFSRNKLASHVLENPSKSGSTLPKAEIESATTIEDVANQTEDN